MAWRQILETTETTGSEFSPAMPFVIRIEGSIGGTTVSLESKRKGDSDVWNVENLGDGFSDDDKAIPITGVPDSVYRIKVTAAGLTAFVNTAYPSASGITR